MKWKGQSGFSEVGQNIDYLLKTQLRLLCSFPNLPQILQEIYRFVILELGLVFVTLDWWWVISQFLLDEETASSLSDSFLPRWRVECSRPLQFARLIIIGIRALRADAPASQSDICNPAIILLVREPSKSKHMVTQTGSYFGVYDVDQQVQVFFR
jgi:hypothetical protein